MEGKEARSKQGEGRGTGREGTARDRQGRRKASREVSHKNSKVYVALMQGVVGGYGALWLA